MDQWFLLNHVCGQNYIIFIQNIQLVCLSSAYNHYFKIQRKMIEDKDAAKTTWQRLVSKKYKLTNFKFPQDQSMKLFQKFSAPKAQDHKILKKYYEELMAKELPDDASYFHTRLRHLKEGKVYQVFCSQWPSYFGQVCRASFKYTYDEQTSQFRLLRCKNLHTHYPHNVTKQQIIELRNIKVEIKKQRLNEDGEKQESKDGITSRLRKKKRTNYCEINPKGRQKFLSEKYSD